jgi:adenylate cyclase
VKIKFSNNLPTQRFLSCKRIAFILFLFIFNSGSTYAQEDSLLSILKFAKTDSVKFSTLIELSKLAQESDLKKAVVYAKQALEVSKRSGNKKDMATAYRFVGLALYYQAEYGPTVENWLNSLAMYDSIGDKTNVARLYSNLGAVYESQSDDPKAQEYNLKSKKVAEEIKDTTRLLTALNNLAVLYGKKPQSFDKGLSYSYEALELAKKIDDQEGVSKVSTNIGEIYFKMGKDTLALEYFQKAIKGYEGSEFLPEAFRNIGKVYEMRGDYNTAESYQMRALLLAEKLDNKRDMTTALLSLADTYLKKGETKLALQSFERARAIADSIDVPEELKIAYSGLANIYSNLKNYEKAYRFQALLTEINDTLYNIEYQQKMSGQLFTYEIEKKQSQITILNKDKELQEIDLKRQKFAKNVSLVGVAMLLVIAFIIFRNYKAKVKINKVLDRQKVEIENLLLNILPAEVAKELQTSGQATPRSYESVSVLFTDFKGFTTIAKDMTPEELVAELNEFFVAFDDIIENNHLEKIKTIGDAYMCAGGIPTTNSTHPIDIVNAGLQIQEFMEEHSRKRIEKGLAPWGLRVGIHTGPVTAGVVGRKKYAYDIWGSAVNIASRMESNGEVGKVNISSATYELVKDTFECKHRGKISAKNVGEIDMYFVEPILSEVKIS